ncbi:acetyl-CoA synthetase-like protein [Clavulina sp. PMI_390]|nr:acetyl-CoA synthetase-like protein [Clavulina sp. PMI_390]
MNTNADFEWVPKRSVEEVDQLIHGPGGPLETHKIVLNRRVVKVIKSTPPNLRTLFLNAVEKHANADYLVLDDERYTYQETLDACSRVASVFRDVYGVRKGDRVAIVMRNYLEWIIAFWACHLLGAVAVCVNAFSPGHVIAHCLTMTTPKVIILDAERAVRLSSHIVQVKTECGATGVLVIAKKGYDDAKRVKIAMQSAGVHDWDKVVGKSTRHAKIAFSQSWRKEAPSEWADDATIFFTSGTTGLPKGVLCSQLNNLSASYQRMINGLRGGLRKGEPVGFWKNPPPLQSSSLLTIPLFHVIGGMATVYGATLQGGKIVLMKKWEVDRAIELLEKEKITTTGGVPSIALDLLENETFLKSKTYLQSITAGGSPVPPHVARNIPKLRGSNADGAVARCVVFSWYSAPKKGRIATYNYMSNAWCNFSAQGYGLTETCAGVASVIGGDSTTRPESTHGPQVMTGYYKNPAATAKVLTKDGWFNSQDLGYVDKEGFLYIKGRVKDLIIRGGENIDAVSVENAFYDDERVLSCAAVGVPDARLGELPAVFVVPKHGMEVTEEELMVGVKERCRDQGGEKKRARKEDSGVRERTGEEKEGRGGIKEKQVPINEQVKKLEERKQMIRSDKSTRDERGFVNESGLGFVGREKQTERIVAG